jgi:hypothetical protein
MLKAAAMEEHLLPIGGTDEAKPAIADYPFDCPLHNHLGLRIGDLRGGPESMSRTAEEGTSRTR